MYEWVKVRDNLLEVVLSFLREFKGLNSAPWLQKLLHFLVGLPGPRQSCLVKAFAQVEFIFIFSTCHYMSHVMET